MAIKTMSASTGGGGNFSEGWHEVTITKADYGVYNAQDGSSKKYIDVWFQDYPENMNLRVYETFNKKDNTEFKIANLFKYANAGIVGVLNDPTGKRPLIQYDDEASGLIGKAVHVYLYKETKTGNNYSRLFDDIAPTVHKGEHLSYDDKAVEAIKKGIAGRCNKLHGIGNGMGTTTPPADATWAGIPE